LELRGFDTLDTLTLIVYAFYLQQLICQYGKKCLINSNIRCKFKFGEKKLFKTAKNIMSLRKKKISKRSSYTRLLIEDRKYLDEQILEHRGRDKNFENLNSVIRYYVHIGIAATLQTDQIEHTLDNAIVKRSQKNAVRDELKPLTNNIKNLYDAIEHLVVRNDNYFGQLIESSKIVEDVVKQRLESFENVMEKVLMTMQTGSGTERESLRNIIVLRSLFYLFLIGHKLGRMESGVEDIKNWQIVVINAHKQANLLSDEELDLMEGGKIDEKVIMNFTAELFEESKRQLQSQKT
jgi:hypothetical protein